MQQIVYENDEFVVFEVMETVPIYEDGSYTPTYPYPDIIHVSGAIKRCDSQMYIKYYYKQNKCHKKINPLKVVDMPMKCDDKCNNIILNKINEIIDYINSK